MSEISSLSPEIIKEKQSIESAAKLHWLHWLIIIGSLALTFGAWQYAKFQVQEKIKNQFIREADRTVELIRERLIKYEDALWAGVAAIHSQSQGIDYQEWKSFSETLKIGERHPGINGIGVIYYIPDQQGKELFLERERNLRPDFKIHPPHEQNEYWPITYIEPAENNMAAIGLDMAHETNRFTAAKKARDTGTAQITGPITLVQDAEKTPGFLFYVPFYLQDSETDTIKDKQQNFIGLVYAPFIMKKLMKGTLEKEKRYAGIQIIDEDVILYDEHIPEEKDYDPAPLFTKKYEINIYGRLWCFDIWSTKSFRDIANNDEPQIILIGGIIIDALILAFFLFMTRSSSKAINFASKMTHEYQNKNKELEKLIEQLSESNEELERFAYVAAHDMQEPLRMTANFSELLEKEHKEQLDEQGQTFLYHCRVGAKRLQAILDDLLVYSRLKNEDDLKETVDTQEVVDTVLDNLQNVIKEKNAKIEVGTLPQISCNPVRFSRLIQNLVSNGIKYQGDNNKPLVKIDAVEKENEWVFSVTDNGIGIKEDYHEQIFQPFKRLHTSSEYNGTGIGLAICHKIVVKMEGKLWVESDGSNGSTFFFTLPKVQGI